MAIQSAMEFIRRVREDEALRDKVRALGPTADLQSLSGVGAEAGYAFTAEELQASFKHDWTMRWLRHGRRRPYYAVPFRAEQAGQP